MIKFENEMKLEEKEVEEEEELKMIEFENKMKDKLINLIEKVEEGKNFNLEVEDDHQRHYFNIVEALMSSLLDYGFHEFGGQREIVVIERGSGRRSINIKKGHNVMSLKEWVEENPLEEIEALWISNAEKRFYVINEEYYIEDCGKDKHSLLNKAYITKEEKPELIYALRVEAGYSFHGNEIKLKRLLSI